MTKKIITVSVLVGLCIIISIGCSITFFPDGDSTTKVPLDEADAVITINQQAGGIEASAVARITDSRGSLVELEVYQAVSVNGQAMTGPDALGEYGRTISAATQYTVTVNEPTLGVEQTTISAPAFFTLTVPASGDTLSLSGFTANWSNADPSLQVKITVTQTIFGTEKTQTFGPFTDTGSLTLDSDDLRRFQQGANLLVTVTKINERRGINGFNSGTLSAELWQSAIAISGP